ncbi:hypothetical protein [Pseudomonas panipatensis]|uniref:Uncharacterized protein n=1 Tax=Pseudomonas panipatensis TaxID=428992 RepID=A0A1G8NBJ5_9PSED|nr:hypothetical protein [Pseudomonas panipatensis]SDI77466.1 hypothetical protein SAMN05216272_1246 [Pseudomonas panipatensis]SMP80232.1 hypothetical protein SAMN06295951_1263 [Pseudomonas panipatensis]
MEVTQLWHLVAVPFVLLGFVPIWHFWRAISLLGLKAEVQRRDQSILYADTLTVWAGLTTISTAVYFTFAKPAPFLVTSFVVAAMCIGFAKIQSRTKHEPTAAGAREEALRTVAKLQLIDAAQLAYALRVSQEYEQARRAGRVFDLDAESGRIIKEVR